MFVVGVECRPQSFRRGGHEPVAENGRVKRGEVYRAGLVLAVAAILLAGGVGNALVGVCAEGGKGVPVKPQEGV